MVLLSVSLSLPLFVSLARSLPLSTSPSASLCLSRALSPNLALSHSGGSIGFFVWGTNGWGFFIWGDKGRFWGGYITVTWHESQVNVMQCCRFLQWILPTNVTSKIYVININISNSSLWKNVKLRCNTVYIDFLDFNILSKIWFPHIDLKLF